MNDHSSPEAHIALQLYTLRALTSIDMLGTLREVAQQGYKAVEFAGYGNSTVEEVRAELDRLGVRGVAIHTNLNALQMDHERILDEARALGSDYVVLASVPQEQRGSVDVARQLAAAFNGFGEACQAAGLQFAYHNHNFEFAPLGGTTPLRGAPYLYNILLENTDPALVKFEFDVFWARFADTDPVEVLGRLAGRVPLLHAKDMEAGEGRADAPMGEGIMPWTEILSAAAAAGVEYYIVEQDHPRNPLRDTEESFKNLKKLLAGN
jgi:sugar phosphate isomerase/epimerase